MPFFFVALLMSPSALRPGAGAAAAAAPPSALPGSGSAHGSCANSATKARRPSASAKAGSSRHASKSGCRRSARSASVRAPQSAYSLAFENQPRRGPRHLEQGHARIATHPTKLWKRATIALHDPALLDLDHHQRLLCPCPCRVVHRLWK